ncbi:MAG: hypothetical protein MMC33_004587 [Icmadophila ericetorum]|nr:hypothetical protein [Icmadophila ericetorum]
MLVSTGAGFAYEVIADIGEDRGDIPSQLLYICKAINLEVLTLRYNFKKCWAWDDTEDRRQNLEEWTTAVQLLQHKLTPSHVNLVFICDAKTLTEATEILDVLVQLPRLKTCTIRLGLQANKVLEHLARETAIKMQSCTNRPSDTKYEFLPELPAFSFSRLPRELRQMILSYTGLAKEYRHDYVDQQLPIRSDDEGNKIARPSRTPADARTFPRRHSLQEEETLFEKYRFMFAEFSNLQGLHSFRVTLGWDRDLESLFERMMMGPDYDSTLDRRCSKVEATQPVTRRGQEAFRVPPQMLESLGLVDASDSGESNA